MLFLTQLIYIKEGQESLFHQFEDIALPLIAKHNGQLLLRVRPDAAAFIGHQARRPYEIHLVQFTTEADFDNFQTDETRKQFLHLKEQAVETVLLIKGNKV